MGQGEDNERRILENRRERERAMNNVKNLAGNDVSIFLFRFELSGNSIDFVLNKAIAADMYPLRIDTVEL